MTRHAFTFFGTFVVGALIALAARTAQHQPHAATPAAIADAPAHHAPGAASPATASKPVNKVCAICGMDVDPTVPTAKYKGKTIGFGCNMCRPKFEAEPDKYGPLYLRNEVIAR